jgi:iron-sulfur cluster assembly protein
MLEQVSQQVTTQGISLSLEATQAVQNIMAEKNLEGYALRIYVSGGGCCGAQFGMALDDNIREIDTTFDANGIKVVVDEVSIDYLQGANVDFVNDPQRGAGFIVDSPNAKSHDHGEESCACGGSCACND